MPIIAEISCWIIDYPRKFLLTYRPVKITVKAVFPIDEKSRYCIIICFKIFLLARFIFHLNMASRLTEVP